MQNNIIEIKNLTKNYGDFKALDNMNMTLEKNKIYGLLGRNGAGKTTMLNVLTSRIFATSGEALVFGEKVFENTEILKKVCFIEEKGFYDNAVRVSNVLKLCSGLYPNWDDDYAQELVTLFELNPKKKFKQLSRGMESALGLIIGLASRAELTVFDEPSLGLDAVIRERFYDAVIDDFSANPRTIVISTHLIDEVSKMFEDVVIVDGGRVLVNTNVAKLREKAFYVSGGEQTVRKACDGAIVMEEEQFGGTLILSVYTDKAIAADGVDIQPIPMQKLFVNIINPKIYDILQKGGVTL